MNKALEILASLNGPIYEYTHPGMSAKLKLHTQGKKFLKHLADDLNLAVGSYDIRSNKAGIAVSGEVTLHGEHIYVQLSEFCGTPGVSILYRACKGRKDYCGLTNNTTKAALLTDDGRYSLFVSSCHKLIDSVKGEQHAR